MVGSAILRKYRLEGFDNLLLRSRKELDLTDQMRVNSFFRSEKPEHVIISAAKVGGIIANDTYRADFIYDNVMIESNIIDASFINNVEKLRALNFVKIITNNMVAIIFQLCRPTYMV